MINQDQLPQLASGGGNVYSTQRDKIGRIGQIYLDDQTHDPKWVTVSTGLFGTSESFVPLTDATADGNDILVGYGKDQVKDAPRIDPDGSLSPDEEQQLYIYYGIDDGGVAGYDTSDTVTDRTDDRSVDTGRTTGRDTSGPTTDNAMTRSEERLNVGTRTEETGRARLRKYVVTENVTKTVPVSHEEVRLEREPITDANRGDAMDGPAISEEEHEVTLHADRPVVEKEAVPVERVRVDTETVTDQETVSEDVRREEIGLDGTDDDGPVSGRGTGTTR
jgi:uncharacterized protein (TIGR02271 family)